MLTEGNFTRDEWNHLVCVFNILNFLMSSCNHFLSTEHHVEENSRKEDRRRTCNGEVKSSEFNINKLVGMLCSHWETCAGQGPEPATNSQEWQRNDYPFSSTRKPAQGVENQPARAKLDYNNMQVSDKQNLVKVFKNLRQKLNLPGSDQILDQKADVLIWGLI